MSEPDTVARVRTWWWILYTAVTLAPVVVTVWAVVTMGAPGNLYVCPTVGLVLSAVLAVIARHLGAKTGSGKTERSLFRGGFFIVIAWAALSVWTVLGGAGVVTWGDREANGQVLSVAFFGLATAVLGNATTVTPPNVWFGLRVGWSSRSPQVWARSQLVTGRILVAVGLAIVVCAFLTPPGVSLAVAVILLLGAGVASTLYARHAALAEGSVPDTWVGGQESAEPSGAGTPDTESGSRRVAAIALTWVPVFVVAVYALWMWDRMPPVIASHWSGGPTPDAYQSPLVVLLEGLLSVPAAAGSTAASIAKPTTVRGHQQRVMLMGIFAGVAAMIATAYILSVQLTIRAGSPERADLGGWTLLVFASILWGALPLITQFRGELRSLAQMNWTGVHWP